MYIRCQDLNSIFLDYESSPSTSRPGLKATLITISSSSIPSKRKRFYVKTWRGKMTLKLNNNLKGNKKMKEKIKRMEKKKVKGWEPRSFGYGRRLMFWRSWVQMPVLYTGRTLLSWRSWLQIPVLFTWWAFFLIDLLSKIVMLVWRKDENKQGSGWPIFKKKYDNKTLMVYD